MRGHVPVATKTPTSLTSLYHIPEPDTPSCLSHNRRATPCRVLLLEDHTGLAEALRGERRTRENQEEEEEEVHGAEKPGRRWET
ncbi:hypothetical protein E2C01_022923 [Portunus trituberculatus]|uniref:Uncharacterized protein n=1 Tax=Portunus trituberculatus TaxID=210409 RepID=A0A5B7E7G3_PORTR|nr:hypothetical protein [Portunus trituberculatus]